MRDYFLLIRKLEQYLDLFSAFEPQFPVNHHHLPALSFPNLAVPGS
jgi:hypothetical protein